MQTKLSNSFLVLGCLSPIAGISLFIYLLFKQSMLAGFIYFGIFIVIMIILIVISSVIEDKRKAKQKHLLSTLQPDVANYHETQSYVAYDLLSKVAIDEKNERIYFWIPENKEIQLLKDASYGMPYRIFDYPYSAILAVQVIEDNSNVSTMLRQSQSARFLLDGLEITNDIHPKKPSNNERIHSMGLKLIMKDQSRPIHTVRFYTDSNSSLNKNSPEYKKAQSEIEQWFTSLHFIIKENDQKEGYFHPQEKKVEQPQIMSEGQLKEEKIQVQHPVHDERKTLVKAQLLPVLNQVIYKKIIDYGAVKKNEFTPLPQENSTSYFDELLEKNRKQLHGKQVDE